MDLTVYTPLERGRTGLSDCKYESGGNKEIKNVHRKIMMKFRNVPSVRRGNNEVFDCPQMPISTQGAKQQTAKGMGTTPAIVPEGELDNNNPLDMIFNIVALSSISRLHYQWV